MVKELTQNIKASFNGRIAIVLKALILSYIITIPMFMLFAFILSYTVFPEKYMPTAVIITTLLSLLAAGSITTRGANSKGWLNGAVSGALYVMILYIASSIMFKDYSIDRNVLTMFLIGVLTGAIGGILGINMKSGSKSKSKTKSKQKASKK